MQPGAKEVNSRGDSYFVPSRPGQFPVVWGLAPSLGPRGHQGDLWAVGNACSESQLLAPPDAGMLRAGSTARDGEWGSGGRDPPAVKGWSIAGEKQKKGKGRGGSKTPAMTRAGNGDRGMKWDYPPGRESEATGYGILQNTPRAGAFVSADDLAENLNLTVSL